MKHTKIDTKYTSANESSPLPLPFACERARVYLMYLFCIYVLQWLAHFDNILNTPVTLFSPQNIYGKHTNEYTHRTRQKNTIAINKSATVVLQSDLENIRRIYVAEALVACAWAFLFGDALCFCSIRNFISHTSLDNA